MRGLLQGIVRRGLSEVESGDFLGLLVRLLLFFSLRNVLGRV